MYAAVGSGFNIIGIYGTFKDVPIPLGSSSKRAWLIDGALEKAVRIELETNGGKISPERFIELSRINRQN